MSKDQCTSKYEMPLRNTYWDGKHHDGLVSKVVWPMMINGSGPELSSKKMSPFEMIDEGQAQSGMFCKVLTCPDPH